MSDSYDNAKADKAATGEFCEICPKCKKPMNFDSDTWYYDCGCDLNPPIPDVDEVKVYCQCGSGKILAPDESSCGQC